MLVWSDEESVVLYCLTKQYIPQKEEVKKEKNMVFMINIIL